MSAILFSNVIGPIPVECGISEEHESELTITTLPIEKAAQVTDHAFLEPKRVTLEITDSHGAASYNALLLFQSTIFPFVLVTGLSVYPNMLIKNIRAFRDKQYSNILKATVTLQEVLFVDSGFSPIATAIIGTVAGGIAGGTNSKEAANPVPARVKSASMKIMATGVSQFGDVSFGTEGTENVPGLIGGIQ